MSVRSWASRPLTAGWEPTTTTAASLPFTAATASATPLRTTSFV